MADSAFDYLIRVGLEDQTEAQMQELNGTLQKGGSLIREQESAYKRLESAKKSAAGTSELKQINGEQAKLNGLIDRTTTALKQQQNTSFALSQILREAPAFAFSFQTGLLGISNNIPILLDRIKELRKANADLLAQGQKAPSVFGTLVKSLGSFGNVATLAISVLTIFGGKLFELATGADKAKKELSDFEKSMKAVGDEAGKEISKMETLRLAAENTTLSYKERAKAVDELQRIFPEYFSNLDREKILNGQVGDTYKELSKDIIDSAKARARGQALTDTISKLIQVQSKLDAIRNPKNGAFVYATPFDIQQLEEQEKALQLSIDAQERLITNAQNAKGQSFGFVNPADRKFFEDQQKAQKADALLSESERKKRDADAKKADAEAIRNEKRRGETLEKIRLSFLAKQQDFNEAELQRFEKDQEEATERVKDFYKEMSIFVDGLIKRDIEDNLNERAPVLSQGEAEDLKRELLLLQQIKAIKKQISEEEAEAFARKKANTDRVAAEAEFYDQQYAILLNSVSQFISIEQQKTDSLLAEQQKRVENAREIAKQGNAVILKAEEDRLRSLEKQREDYAEKQRTINAALVASQSAVNIVQAVGAVLTATPGDPYTLIARVAAAVAAVIGGVASVTTAIKNIEAGSGYFKGGYTGDGDPHEVAGEVHKGEVVFDHKATRRIGKDTLERLRMGKIDVVGNKLLAMPMLDYAAMNKEASEIKQFERNSGIDLREVVKELKELKDAYNGNGGTSINFDENGISVLMDQHNRNKFRYKKMRR